MFQVENEYGSYGKEKDYLKSVANLMRNHGLTAPFFTSDGPWRAFCVQVHSLLMIYWSLEILVQERTKIFR